MPRWPRASSRWDDPLGSRSIQSSMDEGMAEARHLIRVAVAGGLAYPGVVAVQVAGQLLDLNLVAHEDVEDGEATGGGDGTAMMDMAVVKARCMAQSIHGEEDKADAGDSVHGEKLARPAVD